MNVLKNREGNLVIWVPVLMIVFLTGLFSLCEYSRMLSIAAKTRDAVQAAVTQVCTQNTGNVYPGVREGYAGGYRLENSVWRENIDSDGILKKVDEKLGTSNGTKTVDGKTVYQISDLSVHLENTPLAPSNDVSQLNGTASYTLTVPLSFGRFHFPPLVIPMTVKSGYSPQGSASFHSEEDNTNGVQVSELRLSESDLTLCKGDTIVLGATLIPVNAQNRHITWSSGDSSVCTVTQTGVVSAIAPGETSITAIAESGAMAVCRVTVISPVTSVSLNLSQITMIPGATEQLTATVFPEDADNKSVLWVSSNPEVCTVDNSGKVTAVSAGQSTITVMTLDGGLYAECVIQVTVPVTGITLDKTQLKLSKGATDTLTATIWPSNASCPDVLWASSDSSVCSVDETGHIQAKAVGSAVISATTKDGAYTATCHVNVAVPVTGVMVTPSTLTLKQGTSTSLSAVVLPDDATDQTISWSSSDSSIASVDSDGNVTAVNVGTATITATTNDGGYTSSCVVTVKPSTYRVTVITSKGGSVLGEGSYPAGTDVTLTAKPDPHYSFICWKDDNGSVVGVGQTYTIHDLSSDTTLKADFAPELFTVVVQAGTGGSVTGSGTYAYGTTVTIKATPDSGYEFSKWSDGSTETERTITVTNDVNLTASFRMVTEESLFRIEDYGDGTCAVIGFDSDADIPNVVIPSYIDGKKVVELKGIWGGFGIFCWNDNVKTVVIPNTVTSIGKQAFANCDSITTVIIPNSVISIGDDAFYKCSSLVSVHIPDSVTSIGNLAFAHCSSLTSINVPDSVVSIDDSAFENCSSLKQITLSHSLTKIEAFMFAKCTSLQSIYLPDSITEIGTAAFQDCTSLTTIHIPSSIKKIGSFAFDGCTSIRSIDIPRSVQSIGEYAFNEWTSQQTIYMHGFANQSEADSKFKSEADSIFDFHYIFPGIWRSNYGPIVWKSFFPYTDDDTPIKARIVYCG
jgi:uncharacterized protein YjdB